MVRRHVAPLLIIALCAGFAQSARADEASEQQAIEHHRKALELYDAGDMSLALVEFERAYAANGNYKPLFNMGQIHFQLGHYAKARLALEKYLSEGGTQIAEGRRTDVEGDLVKLRLRTAHVAVTVHPEDSEIHVGDDVAPSGTQVLVDAGKVTIRVDKPGFASQSRQLVLAGGEEQSVTIDLAGVAVPPPRPITREEPHASGLPPLAVAGWITASALLAGTVGVGIGALSASSHYEDDRKAPINGTPAEAKRDLEHQRHTVQALAATADVLGAATLITGGLSLYLTVRRRPTKASVSPQGLGARFEMSF